MDKDSKGQRKGEMRLWGATRSGMDKDSIEQRKGEMSLWGNKERYG